MKKENKIFIIISVVLFLLILFPLFYFFINNNEEKKPVNDKTVTEEKIKKELRLSIESTTKNILGDFILMPDGTAYFIEDDKTKFDYSDKNNIGIKNDYVFGHYNNSMICNEKPCKKGAYKLDIENVIGAYKENYGNGADTASIILITSDGKVNELVFVKDNNNNNSYLVSFHKNVFDHPNILYLLSENDFSGNYSILVSKEGNMYSYFGVSSMKEF